MILFLFFHLFLQSYKGHVRFDYSPNIKLKAVLSRILQQQQNVLNNNGKKPPSSRREKEKRRERKSESSHDGGESKENQEAQPDPLGDLPQDGESKAGQDGKSAALKKRGGEGEDIFSDDEAR